MRRGKHFRKKQGVFDVYIVLILIAILFLGIAYADITKEELMVIGNAETDVQEGVFITKIIYKSSVDADVENSKINYYLKTMMDSKVVLGSSSTSTITYEVTIYNNTNTEKIYIGALTDDTDEILYSNTNIGYSVDIEEYVTTIAPGKSLTFTITFSYEGTDTSNSILNSKLNFRFKDKPTITLNNDGQYTIENIYPDYTPQEYEFTVTNYTESETNIVPMSYYFETTIDKPLTAKIYDENGNEVTEAISIDGDGETQTSHTYTLKIIWDDSNTEEGIAYNDAQYADETFSCIVALIATPNGENKDKYIGYTLTDDLQVDIKPASFNFDVNIASTNLIIKNNATSLAMTVGNNSSNIFNVDYEIILDENDNFDVSIDGESAVNNKFQRTYTKGTTIEAFDIDFSGDINIINPTESLSLQIVTNGPYVQETINYDITISLHAVTVTLDANGGISNPSTITVYHGRTYEDLPTPVWAGHTFNGWYSAETGGTKYETTTQVTTDSSTQTLYAQWTTHLLADLAQVGDYVNYPVEYENVYAYRRYFI